MDSLEKFTVKKVQDIQFLRAECFTAELYHKKKKDKNNVSLVHVKKELNFLNF